MGWFRRYRWITATRHRSWTKVPRMLSFSGVLFLSGVLFPLLFFTFCEIGLVRSQIGGELARKTAIFGIATIWKCVKPCPMSKKVWGKKRKWNVRSQNSKDARSEIGRGNRHATIMCGWLMLQRRGKPCPICKKWGEKEKMGCPISKKTGISDLRSSGKLDLIWRCWDARRLADAKNNVWSHKKWGEKEIMECMISKNIGKMGQKVGKIVDHLDQGENEDCLHNNQHTKLQPKNREILGKKMKSDLNKKSQTDCK